MKNFKEKLYLSTIDENAPKLAKQYQLGIELSQFCDTTNLDTNLVSAEQSIGFCLKQSNRFIVHAPFSELSPATIDPEILAVVKKRFQQTAALSQRFGIRRMVVHSGYIPLVYFKEWFHDRSIPFWKELLSELPADFELLYENVMDDEPMMLKNIVNEVADPRFKLCLDIGHLNVISKIPAKEWIDAYGTALGHVHVHNNHKDWDTHSQLFDGTLDIPAILEQVFGTSPDATFTLELMDAAPSIQWLIEKGLLQ